MIIQTILWRCNRLNDGHHSPFNRRQLILINERHTAALLGVGHVRRGALWIQLTGQRLTKKHSSGRVTCSVTMSSATVTAAWMARPSLLTQHLLSFCKIFVSQEWKKNVHAVFSTLESRNCFLRPWAGFGHWFLIPPREMALKAAKKDLGFESHRPHFFPLSPLLMFKYCRVTYNLYDLTTENNCLDAFNSEKPEIPYAISGSNPTVLIYFSFSFSF